VSETEQVSEDERRVYIAFKLGGELFAIDASCVRDVIDVSHIAGISTASLVGGVVNVQGKAVPVLELRHELGLPDVAPTADKCILIFKVCIDGEVYLVGGLADSIHDMIELGPRDIAPPPRLAARRRRELVAGITARESAFIVLLDVQRLLGLEDLAAIHFPRASEAPRVNDSPDTDAQSSILATQVNQTRSASSVVES
jgi:purine-binding chemotaxis protein CheW